MAILGCVLLRLPDETPTTSTSGTCGISGVRPAPRNDDLRALTIGLPQVSAVAPLLSPFCRIETTRLLRSEPGTTPLPRTARTPKRSTRPTVGSPATRRRSSTGRAGRRAPATRRAHFADAPTCAARDRVLVDGDAASSAPSFVEVASRPVRRLISVVLLVTRASVRREDAGLAHVLPAQSPTRSWERGAHAIRHRIAARTVAIARSESVAAVAYRWVRSAYQPISVSGGRSRVLRRWKADPTGNYLPVAASPRNVAAAVSAAPHRPPFRRPAASLSLRRPATLLPLWRPAMPTSATMSRQESLSCGRRVRRTPRRIAAADMRSSEPASRRAAPNRRRDAQLRTGVETSRRNVKTSRTEPLQTE